MNTLPEIRPIRRALIRPCSVCSQFIRLNGRLGWLTLGRDGYEFKTCFETLILPWHDGLFDDAEATDEGDLARFDGQRRAIASELTSYYASHCYTAD